MKTWIEPKPFKYGDTGLTGQFFEVTAAGDAKDHLLPTFEEP
jgi:hypothetical protein